MRKFFVVIFTFLLIDYASAQDPHFSQFYASPLTLNPAFTGKFDGDYRLAANYRNQWASIPNAYTTASASFDFGILKKSLPKGDILGLGFSGLTDQSANGALKLNYGSVSLAYHKALDDDDYNTLGAGFQATYSGLDLDASKLTFADQLQANGFTGTTTEQFKNGKYKNYLDMNAGVLFSGSSDGENNYYGGLSLYHINSPVVGFQDKNWKLNPRITAHAGGTFPLDEQYSISASAIEQIQDQANESVLGAALCINTNNDDNDDNPTNVYIGSWYRVGDAVIPYVGLEFNGLRIGTTYDINLSSLKAATAEKGGAEFSLIYIKKDYDNKGIPCPKF